MERTDRNRAELSSEFSEPRRPDPAVDRRNDLSVHRDLSEHGDLSIHDLVERFHGAAYAYAFRLTGNPQDAEDIVQQAFMIAHQRLHQLREPARAKSWLLTIVRTHFLKSVQRRTPVDASSKEIDLNQLGESDNSRWDFDSEQLQIALNRLSVDFRDVVVMFYFEELSYKEVAERLDIPPGTVMSRLARAKKYLRQYLLEVMNPADLPFRSPPGTSETQ